MFCTINATGRYVCNTEIGNLSNKNCIVFSNMRIDAVSAEVLRAIRRYIEAAATGSRIVGSRCERLRQSELALNKRAMR